MDDYKLKIEIFKFKLKHKPEKVLDPSFRDLFSLKYGESEEISDTELLKKFNTDLSNKLNNKGEYIQIGKKAKKAFSVHELPNLSSENHVSFGVLKGGYKGKNKTSSDFEDKSTNESLDGKVINNEHFFLLYTPLDNNIGFLIFQSYPQENIRLDFATFLVRTIFKHDKTYLNMEVEPFLPEQIKNDFKKGATVSQLMFTDNILAGNLSDKSTILNGPSEYRVKVIIEPTGKGNLKAENLDNGVFKQIRKLIALKKPLSAVSYTHLTLPTNREV
eukprot:TRINITY_DN389_c0_g2_i1.p1 TRINITY_DN389_c0_g2~~TRINITY_DN389_c0_g2_i1.p1  ORF type:complete len:274 (-),score=40.21 TRINITY_DN389_c0_g2_i1:23-844(-)